MREAWGDKSDKISVRQVLDLYPQLGIPHFQRGYVWGNSSVSALLESLYNGIPCGSFVFWKSPYNPKNGIPLDPKQASFLYLIIDGQQRIRSLLYAFKDVDLDEEDDPDETIGYSGQENEETDRRLWCVNLTEVPVLKDYLVPHAKKFSLFIFATDPKEANPRSLLRFNIMPLTFLREHESYEEYRQYLYFSSNKTDNEGFGNAFAQLRQNLGQIENRTFFVTTIPETSNKAEMVSLYNRINSGGKRVEPEERAFARLVALHDTTWDHISDIFELVHPKPDLQRLERRSRNEVLARKKEKNFGFRLFLRTFLQVCHFHFGIAPGSFSFGIVEKSAFIGRLAALRADEVKWLWDQTSGVLKCVRDVLETYLKCDSLSFLPESTSLMPVFQLLIQYPDIKPDIKKVQYAQVIASLILHLMIADLGSEEVLKMVGRIAGKIHVFNRLLLSLMEQLERRVKQCLAQKEDNALTKADTLQNRYVLLLYWLERRNSARDFSYENLPPRRPKGPERPLSQVINPEKQHIIPFSKLGEMLDDRDARRTARHPFNNIGNLTYISGEENWDIGSDFLKLECEPNDNLTNHYLNGSENAGQEALKLYLAIRETVNGEKERVSDSKKLRELYDDFCLRRRLLIAQGFSTWIEQLNASAYEALGVARFSDLRGNEQTHNRLESVLPRFVSPEHLTAAQLIRKFEYPNDVEDALIDTLEQLKNRSNKAGDRLVLQLTKRKHVYIEGSRDSLALRFNEKLPLSIREEIAGILEVDAVGGLIFQRDSSERGALRKLGELQQIVSKREEEIDAAIKSAPRPPKPKSERRKWDENDFLNAAKERVGPGRDFIIIKSVYELAKNMGLVNWGTGIGSGSFTLKVPHPKSRKGAISLFTLWTDGTIELRAGNIGKRVGHDELDRFFKELEAALHKPLARDGYGPKFNCRTLFPEDKILKDFGLAISGYLKETRDI